MLYSNYPNVNIYQVSLLLESLEPDLYKPDYTRIDNIPPTQQEKAQLKNASALLNFLKSNGFIESDIYASKSIRDWLIQYLRETGNSEGLSIVSEQSRFDLKRSLPQKVVQSLEPSEQKKITLTRSGDKSFISNNVIPFQGKSLNA